MSDGHAPRNNLFLYLGVDFGLSGQNVLRVEIHRGIDHLAEVGNGGLALGEPPSSSNTFTTPLAHSTSAGSGA